MPSDGCQVLFPLPSALRNAQGARGAGGLDPAGALFAAAGGGGGTGGAPFAVGGAPQDAVAPGADADAACVLERAGDAAVAGSAVGDGCGGEGVGYPACGCGGAG